MRTTPTKTLWKFSQMTFVWPVVGRGEQYQLYDHQPLTNWGRDKLLGYGN